MEGVIEVFCWAITGRRAFINPLDFWLSIAQLLQLRALADLQALADELGNQRFDPAPEELIRQHRSP